jgi:mono/diheme cytochrome c family protein
MRPVTLLVSALAFTTLVGSGAKADDGADIYNRCAACHLPDGAGVPGAFPPLAGRMDDMAATEQGRDYLVHVVARGLMGAIDVNGVTYRGVMPAQAGLDNTAIAQVLNFLLKLEKDDVSSASFTTEEVARLREAKPNLNPRQVRDLRPDGATLSEGAP